MPTPPTSLRPVPEARASIVWERFALNALAGNTLETPALLLHRPTLHRNIAAMIRQAGGTARLRPHVKTHKCPAVVQAFLAAGVGKFKCATVAEAEMVARAGAEHVMVAYPLTGPWPERLAALAVEHPRAAFAATADHLGAVEALNQAAAHAGCRLDVYLDLDPGLHRTGIAPGPDAEAVYAALHAADGLRAGGFHVYDGHLRQHDPQDRARAIAEAFAPIDALRRRLIDRELPVPRLIAGGTGSFPIHARFPDRECSPGTCTLSDTRSRDEFADIDYPIAAAVATRVVSRPGRGRLTFDLGHKAIASESPVDRRVSLHAAGLDEPLSFEPLIHSEEHLTVRTGLADRFSIGDVLLAVPYHICPTCALHQQFIVIDEGNIVAYWPITERSRQRHPTA